METPPAESPPLHGWQKFLANENVLAFLITVMTILTAVAAYQASLANGDSLKHFFIAQAEFTDATLFYIEQGQEIFYDHQVYDQYQIALLEEEQARATYYLAQLSDPGTAAFNRNPQAPFDTQYYNTLYAQAKTTVQDGEEAYELAVEFNLKGDRLGLVTTILAVGMAFAAWGSLAKADSRQRILFTGLGLVALGLAIIEYGRILAS